ncbi:MAG: methyl-accepting chemotaxis protein [Negativicutes bacterium]|nr:methyl-accepting chemotaxis protein [Negativicutes bacterium]
MKSLQTKLTVIILAIFLVSLGALGGLNYWKARQIITENITKDMVVEAERSAIDVGDLIEIRKSELTLLASTPVMVSGNTEAIIPMLAAAKNTNKTYDDIVYVDLNGESVNSRGVKINVADRAFFKSAANGKAFVSDPLVSRGSGRLIVVISIPVKAGDKVVGVLFGATDFEILSQKVLSIKVGQTGYSYVLQGDGLVIMHPNKDLVMKSNGLTDDIYSPINKANNTRMVSRETGFSRYEYAGIDKMIAFAPVPGTSWSLAVTGPVAEMTGAISGLTTISLITIVVVLIISVLAITVLTRKIVGPLRKLVVFAGEVADGDISERQRTIYSQDEIGLLADAMFTMRTNLRGLITKVRASTDHVAASSEELTASAEQSAQAASQVANVISEVATGAEKQLKAVNDTASIVGQMSASIQQIAANANTVAGTSAKSAEEAQEGSKAVEKAIIQMVQIEDSVVRSSQVVSKLGERSKEIGAIVDTISGIAGQTNLLALNAAIEAARAGEAGRGFAVVAEEVRKLAEQSEVAAKQIAALIGEIRQDTDSAVVAMNEGTKEVHVGAEVVNNAGKAFQLIYRSITEVSTQMREITDAIQQMANGSQQIVSAVREIDVISKDTSSQAQTVSATTEEQSATMEEIAASSQTLAKMAEELTQAVSRFKL